MSRLRAAAACLVAALVFAPAVGAGVSPYVRADFGGNQLRMSDANDFVHRLQQNFETAGYSPDFHEVGSGNGPGVTAGLWLLPGLRVGATYSYLLSKVGNYVHAPGDLYYADEAQFRMTEVGGEVAVRMKQWAGLTVGATVAQGRATLSEGYSFEDYLAGSYTYTDGVGHRSMTTYGGYIGLDQTNLAGVAGFVRAGWQYRDLGRITSHIVATQDGATSSYDSQSVWLDFSGFYFKVGVGYDLVR